MRRHNHLRALSALGLTPEKLLLPAILNCPLCGQNTLQLFNDEYADDIWLNCKACSVRGNIILFGAHLWNISLPDALTKFSDLGLAPESEANRIIAEYLRWSTKQKAAETFWFDAEAQIWNHGDDVITCRLRELGIKPEIDTCYGLLGVAHHDQIAKVCAAIGRPKPPRFRDDGASIVLPFYDLPGRLTGFLIIQYNDAFAAKQYFIPLSGSKRRKPDAGYFMLNALVDANPAFLKNTQFVVEDHLWAIKAQCEYLARGQNLLPIAASYSGPEAESYGTTINDLGFANRIFHGPTTTPELVSRACNARGYLSLAPIGPNATVIGRLSAMRAGAQTWQQTLKTAVESVNEANAQAFLSRLTIPHDKLHAFLTKYESLFAPGFKDRVMVAAQAAPQPSVRIHRYGAVIEKDNGWWTHYGKQISNIRIVIAEVIHADNGDKTYRGYVYIDNESYEFNDSAKRIESIGLLAYADTLLAPKGKLVTYEPMWNHSSHLVAMRLRPPKLTNVSTKYGWDDIANVFRTSRYEITHTGDVRATPTWLGQKLDKVFPEPTTVAPLPFHELLTPSHENAFVWAVSAAIIGTTIAPMLRQDPTAIGIAGNNFDLATKIAQTLGCTVEKTSSFQKRAAKKFLADISEQATWPVVACTLFSDEIFNANIPHFFNRPLIMRVYGPTAAAALGYGWQVVQDTKIEKPVNLSALSYVLPAYVQKIIRARLQMFDKGDNLTDAILADLHGWFSATYGTTFNLPYSRGLLTYADNAHEALLQSVNTAISDGKIAILPQPRRARQAGNYVIRKNDYWWLNRRAIDRYFYMAQSVTPNWLKIVDLLQQNGVYGGEEVVHNMRGIFVKTDWCDQFYSPPEKAIDKEIG